MQKKKKSSIEIPPIYKKIGKFLQFFSNKWAAKYALHLFFTPIRFATPKREMGMDSASHQYKMFVQSIDKQINIYEYGKGEKMILLVHGWSGRGTQLFSLADFLVEKGYKIVSFDAPAHGKSEGKKTYMKEFVACILEICQKYKAFDAIIGHSLGAMSCVNAVRLGAKTSCLVCIGGGDLVSDIIEDFIRKMDMNQYVREFITSHLTHKLQEDINEYSVSVAVKNISVPLLIIHDEDDHDVPVQSAHQIHRAAPDSQLIITQGLGHRRVLADDKVIQSAYDFVTKNTK